MERPTRTRRTEYVITLRYLGDPTDAGRRLAGLLKYALRVFRFRCVEAREVKD